MPMGMYFKVMYCRELHSKCMVQAGKLNETRYIISFPIQVGMLTFVNKILHLNQPRTLADI